MPVGGLQLLLYHPSNLRKSSQNSFIYSWARGYGVFSISASVIEKVKSYIRNQSEHHRQKIVADELGDFLSVHGLEKCTAVMVCYSYFMIDC